MVYPLVLVSILCYRVQTQEETATHYYFMEITGLVWVREVEWRDKRVTPFLTSGRRDFFHSLHPLYTCKIFFMLPFPGIFNIIISWDLFAPKGKPPNKRYKRLYNSGISLSLSDNPLHRGTIPCDLQDNSVLPWDLRIISAEESPDQPLPTLWIKDFIISFFIYNFMHT